MADLYFLDTNGNMFVVPDAPQGYVREDGATMISPPPSPDHHWIDGEWSLPDEPEPSTDPADYPLLPWQFKAIVDYLGKDDEIRSAIGTIQEPLPRAASMSRYLHASAYEYGDPLLQQMRQAVGMSEEDLSAAWMLAKDLRSV